ncbi:hypothetical protein QUB43_07645, partial [Microcoleus sp. A6-D4]|uniref:hypothetical protein n=1 Tax=Microcoleus sp. A6-D4 TaxID=2818552 RepID=UPI002FD7E3E9
MRDYQKPGFFGYFSSLNPKLVETGFLAPENQPDARLSETRFLWIFLVTQPKTRRNRVSRPMRDLEELITNN